MTAVTVGKARTACVLQFLHMPMPVQQQESRSVAGGRLFVVSFEKLWEISVTFSLVNLNTLAHRRNTEETLFASLIEQRNVNGETNDFLSSDTSQNDCLLAKTGILYFYRLIQPVTMFSMLIKHVKNKNKANCIVKIDPFLI